MDEKQQIRRAVLVYILFTLTIALSNRFMYVFDITSQAWMQTVSILLITIFAIPVAGILLPLYLARKWNVTFSFWPRNKNVLHVIFFFALWFILFNFQNLSDLRNQNILFSQIFIHFIKTLFLQITTYTLFMILLFPVFRKRYGLWWSLFGTSILYTLYHQAQFYFFPLGITMTMRAYLFITFIAYLLIYIWSESVILTGLVHISSHTLMLISEEILYTGTDIWFWSILIILTATLVYMIRESVIKRKLPQDNRDFWMYVKMKD